jgi:hypothetical protein
MGKWIAGILLLAVVGGGGYFAWTNRELPATLEMGTAYIAKGTCSCLFVSDLEPAQCARDYPPDTYALTKVEIDREGQSVRVTGPVGLYPAVARFEQDYGCSLVQ